MSVPSSSNTYIWLVCALAFSSASNPVLSVVIPGWVLPAMVFLRICCQVSISVRTSYKVAPSIWRCSGGLGAPFRIAWKVTSLRRPWLKKRLATMHSWTMSSLPASCRLVKCGSVLPRRENRVNSRGKASLEYAMCRLA